MTITSDKISSLNLASSATNERLSKSSLSSDFETYLKMLTVQMKNQDPLDPTDASEFSLQLATFSSLEQQVLTNQLLEGMLPYANNSDSFSMLDALGRKAFVESDAIYRGHPIEVRLPNLPKHDKAIMEVQDEFGDIIDTKIILSDDRSLTWPSDANASAIEDGVYRFFVQTYSDGQLVQTSQAFTPHTITEVMKSDFEFELILENGESYNSNSVYGFTDK